MPSLGRWPVARRSLARGLARGNGALLREGEVEDQLNFPNESESRTNGEESTTTKRAHQRLYLHLLSETETVPALVPEKLLVVH